MERVESYKEQIGMAEDQIKFYKTQRDAKDQLGEQIYNSMRDQVSYQEEKSMQVQNELIPMRSSAIPNLEIEKHEAV